MRHNLPFVALITVVVIVIGGYLGITSLNDKNVPPPNRNIKVSPLEAKNISLSSVSSSQEKASVRSAEAADIPSVDAQAGERLVWGEVKAVDLERRVLTIDQEMDDNSVQISPNVAVLKEAVIRTKLESISLTQVKPGDTAGIIITNTGKARAVLVNY